MILINIRVVIQFSTMTHNDRGSDTVTYQYAMCLSKTKTIPK